MIQALEIKLLPNGTIEIARGDYLGHFVGTFKTIKSDTPNGFIYDVNGDHFDRLPAALNAAMARAYDYVAQQEDEAPANS
jgi:hypothetical protein